MEKIKDLEKNKDTLFDDSFKFSEDVTKNHR